MIRSSFVLGFALLTASLLLTGCGKPAENTKGTQAAHEHDHPDEGPHHGHLIELGEEEYHAELVHDDAAGKVVVYVLDNTAKESTAADNEQVALSILIGGQPKEFILKAADATKRDQFESSEKELVDALDHDKEFKGRLHVSIGNKEFVGIIQHEEHHDHDHKQ